MLYTPQPFYLAVTDNQWFQFHHSNQSLEVNFWKPSATSFKAIQPGQNLLFKLKSPNNHVVGGGTFLRSEKTRVSEAWRLYGAMNGFRTFGEFQNSLQSMNRSLQNRRKNKVTMNPIFGLGHEIWELKEKNQKSFEKKIQVFLGEKRRRHT